MCLSQPTRALLWSSLLGLAVAKAIPQIIPGSDTCQNVPSSLYKINNAGQRVAGASFIGNEAVPGSGGSNTISDANTYTVGVTITVGVNFEIDIDEVFNKLLGIDIGASVSVSHTTTNGVVGTASLTCPEGPWRCGISITPTMLQVSGTKYISENVNAGCAPQIWQPYTVQYPVTNDEHLALLSTEICVCDDEYAHAPGAPATICPQACPLPEA